MGQISGSNLAYSRSVTVPKENFWHNVLEGNYVGSLYKLIEDQKTDLKKKAKLPPAYEYDE